MLRSKSLALAGLRSKAAEFISLEFKKGFHTRVRASSRIGPHNQDVLSVIIGSLLGDGYANARTIEGVRFSYRQSEIHKDYLFWLYEFFSKEVTVHLLNLEDILEELKVKSIMVMNLILLLLEVLNESIIIYKRV